MRGSGYGSLAVIMIATRRKAAFGLVILLTVAAIEIALRATSVNRGHVQFVLGKTWYYLAPFDVPKALPEVTPQPGSYRRYDPFLGWTTAELGAEPPLCYSDADGFRCSKDRYLQLKNGAPTRETRDYDIVCIGDSFTHGDEVSYEESWPYFLGAQTGLRVLNLGVGGFGIDQATLRYERLKPTAKLVLLGLIDGDLERALTQVYQLSGGGLKTKPVFWFEDNKTGLHNQPCIHGEALKREFSLGAASSFFQREPKFNPLWFRHEFMDIFYTYRLAKSYPIWRKDWQPPVYRSDDARLAYCLKVLKHLRSVVEKNQARLVVVILGNEDLPDRPAISQPWTLMEGRLASERIEFLNTSDMLYGIYRQGRNAVFNANGVHYTPAANKKVAEVVAEKLRLR